jgi:hypothetical protein
MMYILVWGARKDALDAEWYVVVVQLEAGAVVNDGNRSDRVTDPEADRP